MRKTFRGTRPKPPIGFIILPMIDVIFLLLLFFVMVTSFEASAKIRVDVPSPEKSQARRQESAKKVVINCEAAGSDSSASVDALYRIGADPPEPLSAISTRLAAAKTANPRLTVIIRADRRLPYSHVQAVMRIVAENGIEVMKVSAMRELGS